MNNTLIIVVSSAISDLSRWHKVSIMTLVTTALFAGVYMLVRRKGHELIHGKPRHVPTKEELCALCVWWILDETRRIGRVISPEVQGGIVGLIPTSVPHSDDWLLLVRINKVSKLYPPAEICYGIDAISEHKVLAADIAVALRSKGWTVMAGPSVDMNSEQDGYHPASALRGELASVA